MANYSSINQEVLAERLTHAFKKLRVGKESTMKILSNCKVDLSALKRLTEEANLLKILTQDRNAKIYDYPDPETESGKEAIQVMALWLYENKRNQGKNGSMKPTQIGTVVQSSPLVPPTSTENIIKWTTKILMEVSAPLPKGTPAGFAREMMLKDEMIAEQAAKIREMQEQLKPFLKAIEKAAERFAH